VTNSEMSIYCPEKVEHLYLLNQMRNPAWFSGSRIRRRPKKGYGETSKGFWSPQSGTGRRTPVRRSRKPAENAEQGKKGHLWMDTRQRG